MLCVLAAGEDAIRHLFSRGTHRQFGYAAILSMLVVYFLGASWTAGSAISSGEYAHGSWLRPWYTSLASGAWRLLIPEMLAGLSTSTQAVLGGMVLISCHPLLSSDCLCTGHSGLRLLHAGVFVPMLLIGACVGRLVGLGMVDMAARAGKGSTG